jgi:electron transfer flavoprotein beta subunit
VQTLTVADLGVGTDEVGLANATTQVVSFEVAPPRQKGEIVKDEGDGGGKIAEFLASRKLI